MYWGWVTIRSAVFADTGAPVEHVPFVKFVGLGRKIVVPALDRPADATQQLDLIIGYTDDDYHHTQGREHPDRACDVPDRPLRQTLGLDRLPGHGRAECT